MRTQWIIHGILAVWAATITVIGSSLMVGHWVSLPSPEAGENQWRQALAKIQSEQARGHWMAFHFLYLECPCSRRVLKHVSERPPWEGIHERIVLISSESQIGTSTSQLGHDIDYVTPSELTAKYGVESAPLLVVLDPTGMPRYSGGYTSRKQVLDIQDGSIVTRLLAGESVAPLPLYGCAVSNRLKSITDPLGLKYKDNN